MGDVVDLQGQSAGLEDNLELIADCCRFSEKIMSEESVRKKWHFDETTWTRLGEDQSFIEKIEAEKVRRIRTGQQKRERAQVLITKAPDILDAIATDTTASPRHRVDAIKTLDNFCANGPEAVPAADRFIISIVLNSDNAGSEPAALHFNKSIRPLEPGEIDPDDSSPDVDAGVVAAITMKKSQDGGNGNAL